MIAPMTRLLAIAAVVLTAGVVRADDTFDGKAGGAQRIRRIENVVWALTAPCDKGDDTQQRQCRHVRDVRAAELAGATLYIDGELDAFDVGGWDAAKKSAPFSLSGCIRCAGVDVDGKTYYLVATGAPPTWDGGKLRAAKIHDNAKTFADEAAAKAWAKTVANVRVQLLVKIPAKPKWQVQDKAGLAFDIVGYRVYTPCDGAIVAASPTSAAAPADKKQCAAVTVPAAEPVPTGPVVESLSLSMIKDAMQPVVAASAACFETFGVAGKAKLKITILGDGTVGKYEQQGEFIDTPTGECIDKAMKTVTFPRSKKPKTVIAFPITLQ
jgi:hypothetical protein